MVPRHAVDSVPHAGAASGRAADGRALEAGCGTGYLTQLLQRERGWPIVPLDFSGDGLHHARELGVRNPVQGDIRCLPFGDGAFDLVLSLDVLAHLPRGEEVRAARELVRVRGRGGLVVVRTSALDILRSRHGRIRLRTPTLHAPPPDGAFRRRRAYGYCAAATSIPC